MSVRQRSRRKLAGTTDTEWLRRRDYVLAYWRGDDLLECNEFWRREPDVPVGLRTDPLRWRDLLAPPDLAAKMRAERLGLLEARRAWLEGHGYR